MWSEAVSDVKPTPFLVSAPYGSRWKEKTSLDFSETLNGQILRFLSMSDCE